MIFTADLPTTRLTTVSTLADDTAVMALHFDPIQESRNLQIKLDKIQTTTQMEY